MRKVIATVITIMSFLSQTTGFAAQYYVNGTTGDNGNSGTSPDSAKATISAAISVASNGDTIWVAPGTYQSEVLDYDGKSVKIRSEKGPESTIIKSGRAVFDSGEGSGSVLDGFQFLSGAASFIYCSGASPTINNCMLWSCTNTGIYCANNSDATIANSVIWSCHYGGDDATGGGGIRLLSGSDAQIVNCAIKQCSNTSVNGMTRGGGIFCSESDPVISNCILWSNTAIGMSSGCGHGAGAYFWTSMATITNTTISMNQSSLYGGGISADYGSEVYIQNSILWSNLAKLPTLGNQIAIPSSEAEVTVTYCDVMDGEDGVHANPGSDLIWGAGNIETDPLFVDLAGGDLHLTAASPCRDTGSNGFVDDTGIGGDGLGTDRDGLLRVYNSTVDMGALEYGSAYFTCTDMDRESDGDMDLEWNSNNVSGIEYTVYKCDDDFSERLLWAALASDVDDEGTSTDWVDQAVPASGARYYKIMDEGTMVLSRDTLGLMWTTLPVDDGEETLQYLIANPFVPYDDSLDALIGNQLEGDATDKDLSDWVWRWDASIPDWDKGWYNETSGAWKDYDTGTGDPAFDFESGQSYFIYIYPSGDDRDLCLFGKVATAEWSTYVYGFTSLTGRNLLGSCYPMEVSMDDSTLADDGFVGHVIIPTLSDYVEWWNGPTQGYIDRVWYDTDDSLWRNWDSSPTTKKLAPMEGFWVVRKQNRTPLGFTWTYPLPYDIPPTEVPPND